LLIQQHNTDFIDLSRDGLCCDGKEVDGGQDAKLAGEEQQQLDRSAALGSDKGEWRDA
jgi:hypothetical protein